MIVTDSMIHGSENHCCMNFGWSVGSSIIVWCILYKSLDSLKAECNNIQGSLQHSKLGSWPWELQEHPSLQRMKYTSAHYTWHIVDAPTLTSYSSLLFVTNKGFILPWVVLFDSIKKKSLESSSSWRLPGHSSSWSLTWPRKRQQARKE